jgi:hypothetical protein
MKRTNPPALVAPLEVHLEKMRAAADRHLTDRPESERYAWADAKVAEYLHKGILALD